MENFLEKLREFDALRDGTLGNDVIDAETLHSIPPTYSGQEIFESLSSELAGTLKKKSINKFYAHQEEAIKRSLNGENVVLQAPTASGKTLSFQIPMLDSLLREKGRHALMIYPTKALALDQRDQLTKISSHISNGRIQSWWYDGDTEKEYRKSIRMNPPHILITNPDMLNASFLGHADQWQRFLENLKWVIVDEIHEYRGYFGSNVSMILRRFSHYLAQHNVNPQFFLCSATCANAKEHAENLTGLKFHEVSAENAIRPRRTFYFVKPDIPDHQYWDILQLRSVNAGLACLAHGKSVLVFCPTRKFAEDCHRKAISRVENFHEHEQLKIDVDCIRVFRAGLSISMRHEVQEGLKNGSVRLVFTTNALELGIDIGGLDGIILAGFPDSMMSAWQRIGRAGRNWNADAFVLYFARNNPLDQFYAANLRLFLNKPLDDLVVNPENEDLVERHLPCLMHEAPGIDGASEILGQALYDAAMKKLKSGAIPVKDKSWRPHAGIDIRGGGAGMCKLEYGAKEIGTMSVQQQFREAYQKAIYMHGGSTYRVEEVVVSGKERTIRLGKAEPFLKTNPNFFTTLANQEIFDGHKWATRDMEVEAIYGKVAISEILNSVEEIDERSGDVRDRWVPEFNAAKFFNAHACWIRQGARFDSVEAGFSALQHILRVGVSFTIPVDTHDIFPHAIIRDRIVYMVENYSGGIGVARKILEKWRAMLKNGVQVALSCKCMRGCPNCIVPPRSKEELDKVSGIELANLLLAATEKRFDFKYSDGFWERVEI